MSLYSLVFLIASWVHPGAEVTHHAFLDAVAEFAETPERAAELLVFAEHESRMGDALSGRRWDSKAYCELQVRGSPTLEGNPRACVQSWLRIRARAESACGPEMALAGLASGDCHRGTRLAAARASEAAWWLMIARAVRGSTPTPQEEVARK